VSFFFFLFLWGANGIWCREMSVFLSHTFHLSREGFEIGPITFVNNVHGLFAHCTSTKLQILYTVCIYVSPIIHRISGDYFYKLCWQVGVCVCVCMCDGVGACLRTLRTAFVNMPCCSDELLASKCLQTVCSQQSVPEDFNVKVNTVFKPASSSLKRPAGRLWTGCEENADVRMRVNDTGLVYSHWLPVLKRRILLTGFCCIEPTRWPGFTTGGVRTSLRIRRLPFWYRGNRNVLSTS
jgi:hypothetical protein